MGLNKVIGDFKRKLPTPVQKILDNPGHAGIELLGTNVPLWPLVSYRNHFLRILESWSGSIPNQFQWLALIDMFPTALYSDLIQHVEGTDGAKVGWNIERNVETLTGYPYQRIAGCVFSQGANIPGERVGVAYSKTNKNRGFIGGLHTTNRDDFQPLTLEFLETNTSFADFVIRPWIVLASHLGLVARPGDFDTGSIYDPSSKRSALNIKTNITLIQLGKTYQKRSSVPRKIWKFYDCVPVSMNNNNLPYDGTDVKRYDVQWYYSKYSVEGLPFIPIEDIIENFSSGSLLNILNAAGQIKLPKKFEDKLPGPIKEIVQGRSGTAQDAIDAARKLSPDAAKATLAQSTSIAQTALKPRD